MPRYILDPEWERTRPIGGAGMTRYVNDGEVGVVYESTPVFYARPYARYPYWAPEVMALEAKIARARPSVQGLGWWSTDTAGNRYWNPGPPPWAGARNPWCPYRQNCPGPRLCPYCRARLAYNRVERIIGPHLRGDGLGEVTSRGRIEELHCLLKHLLHAEGHAEESIANYARKGDTEAVQVMAKTLDAIRRIRQAVFSSLYGKGEKAYQGVHATKGCARCQADLQGGLACARRAFWRWWLEVQNEEKKRPWPG